MSLNIWIHPSERGILFIGTNEPEYLNVKFWQLAIKADSHRRPLES